jgi:hypothetical protein
MCAVHYGLGNGALQTRHADVETSLKKESAFGSAQIYFGVDGVVSREGNLHIAGHESHGAEKTG